MRPFRTIRDHTGPYRTIRDHRGLYGTIRNHTAPYSTIRDHMGPYRVKLGQRGHTGPYWTIRYIVGPYGTIQEDVTSKEAIASKNYVYGIHPSKTRLKKRYYIFEILPATLTNRNQKI